MINLNEIFQDVKTDQIRQLLNETKDSKTCMWYLMCALDGMVHCGISLSDGRSGHTMAVEGYAQIIVNNTTFNTAMVSDGWDNGVHYLNLDTSQYSDLKGTVFKL